MNNENKTNYLESLLESFIEQPKFAGMTAEEKNVFKQALVQNYNDRITSVIILNMPQEVSEEFTIVAERGDPVETQNFINKHIPNYDMLVQNETTAFLQSLIATSQLDNL